MHKQQVATRLSVAVINLLAWSNLNVGGFARELNVFRVPEYFSPDQCPRVRNEEILRLVFLDVTEFQIRKFLNKKKNRFSKFGIVIQE